MDSVQLTIREGQGYITGALEPDIQESLTKITSYRPLGYQYDWRYKKGKWNGRIELLRHSKFPAGLLERITKHLDRHDVLYELSIDPATTEKPDLPEFELVDVESRWYQDEAVEAALLNPRGGIQAPTGSGKTAIGVRVIVARRKWALVIVPTIDLLHQYRAFLEAHLVDKSDYYGDETGGLGWGRACIGQLGDGVVDPQPITVATIRTAAKAFDVAYTPYEFGEYDDKDDTKVSPGQLREWIEKIGTLIVDESHILGADMVFDIATKLPAPNKYGMSASPWRDDGADIKIEAAIGPNIYRIAASTLVDEGFLVPPVIRVISTQGMWVPGAWGQTCARCKASRGRDAKGPVQSCEECGSTSFRSEFTDAYREEIVENFIRNQLVTSEVEKLEVPTLVLVKQVKHGRILQDMMEGSRFLSGKDKGSERVEVYDSIREGELRILIATTIADMGLDIPALGALALAGGGKSSTRHLQRIGRVARPFPGKESALVIDFDDGHVHKWFREHAKLRRKIEKDEWGDAAIWI